MNIKEILDKIKVNLGADAPAETTALIADAIRQANDITDSLASANKESATRKAKIRELEAELEEAKAQAAKASNPTIKAEIERLKKIEADHQALLKAKDDEILNAWKEKAKTLAVDPTSKLHEKIEKIKDQFKLPADGAEITPAEAKANLERFSLLEKTGFFEVESTNTGGKPPIGTTQMTDAVNAILALSKKGIN
mgnify:CR=1 FL=1